MSKKNNLFEPTPGLYYVNPYICLQLYGVSKQLFDDCIDEVQFSCLMNLRALSWPVSIREGENYRFYHLLYSIALELDFTKERKDYWLNSILETFKLKYTTYSKQHSFPIGKYKDLRENKRFVGGLERIFTSIREGKFTRKP